MSGTQTTVNVNVPAVNVSMPTKSVGLAFLLSFLFGPLGMLYSTVAGGIIMGIISVIVGILTLGIGLFITEPICIIWAVVAANSYNKRIMASVGGPKVQ